MIERHLRVKDLGGASGFLPNTPFILLILDPFGNVIEIQQLVTGRPFSLDQLAF